MSATHRKIMRQSQLYIQNSLFESFGLAPIEALYSGCSLIITCYQGIKDLFKYRHEQFCVSNPDDICQIKNMIKKVLAHENNTALLKSFDKEIVTPKNAAKNLYSVIMQA